MVRNVSHSVEGFAAFCHVLPFFTWGIRATRDSLRSCGRSNHTGGRWDNAGRCVCASGAACAAPGARTARLLDLTANEYRAARVFHKKKPNLRIRIRSSSSSCLFGPRSPRGRAGAPRDLQGPRGRRLMHKHITQRCPSIPWCSSDVPGPV